MKTAGHVNISRAKAVGGWMSDQELTWLAEQARKYQYIVEFGVLHGRSTRALADNMMPNGKIWAVDPWTGEYYNEEGNKVAISTYVMPYFKQNLEEYVKNGRVIPVREFSYRFSLPHRVDMVFIDGDHRYETVIKDIKKAFELLRTGGLISGHDYNHPTWPGVKKAVDILVDTMSPVKTEGTIWWAIKS